jgi:hypothetical protein
MVYALTNHLNGGESGRASCRIRYVGFGNSLVIWGITSAGTVHHFALSAADCPTGALSKEVADTASTLPDGTAIRLQDAFIHPILIALCAEEGRGLPPCFQLVPTELKLLCLRHLQVLHHWRRRMDSVVQMLLGC